MFSSCMYGVQFALLVAISFAQFSIKFCSRHRRKYYGNVTVSHSNTYSFQLHSHHNHKCSLCIFYFFFWIEDCYIFDCSIVISILSKRERELQYSFVLRNGGTTSLSDAHTTKTTQSITNVFMRKRIRISFARVVSSFLVESLRWERNESHERVTVRRMPVLYGKSFTAHHVLRTDGVQWRLCGS